jgi:membrane protein
MDLLLNELLRKFPDLTVVAIYIANLILTFFITSFIFGIIFKVLPDAKIEWRHVRVGAFTTAFFFMGGKFLISYYLGHSQMTTAYGTTGSIIVVLLWVYCSAMILYFGAAFTRQYAIEMGSNIYPNRYAVWVEKIEVDSKQPLPKTTDGQKVEEEKKEEKIQEQKAEEEKYNHKTHSIQSVWESFSTPIFAAMANDSNRFQAIISHAKEYGFVFPSSEIYDGLQAVMIMVSGAAN